MGPHPGLRWNVLLRKWMFPLLLTQSGKWEVGLGPRVERVSFYFWGGGERGPEFWEAEDRGSEPQACGKRGSISQG